MQKPFHILRASKKSRARVGKLKTVHGKVPTPAFMTIATRGAVKTLAAHEVKALGADIVLANTYHLFVRPGLEVIKKAGGLHKFMGWDGPILTDSGGYQVFSLAQKRHNSPQPSLNLREGDRLKPPLKIRGGLPAQAGRGSYEPGNGEADYNVRIVRDGAEFIDRLSGRKDMFTPEGVLDIQRILGSDIAMVLDVCAPYPVSKQGAREAMEMTSAWALRAKRAYSIRHTAYRTSRKLSAVSRQLVFGIVQGSVYKDLRERSAHEITALDFDGYAIGGVAVGETARQKRQVVDWVVPHLPENKPRYLMGLGQPEEIVAAVRQGIDMFDCVLPTRNARHGNLYVWKVPAIRHSERSASAVKNPVHIGTGSFAPLRFAQDDTSAGKFYEVIHITNEKYKMDFRPVDSTCTCATCTHHTRAYLRHLFKTAEPLAARLATIHNVKFYLDLMARLRVSIQFGRL